MDLGGRRRSDNFEDRGRGSGGGAPAAIPLQLVFLVTRLLGVKGTLALLGAAAVGYFVLPPSLRDQLLGAATGRQVAPAGSSGGSVCSSSSEAGAACDFSRAVLASTEDVWTEQFAAGALPRAPKAVSAYVTPTLVVFQDGVTTGGCGGATSAAGPFYCPADQKLYIDPGFYAVMEKKLKAPGDFAQAYVIAHEVGHHVQNLIGTSSLSVKGETKNQASVRVELQADCLAGVWGHSARAALSITEDDLGEALGAAHAIGDDTLGHSNAADYTHGTSQQRMRWFRRGFDSGNAAECDTFSVPKP